MDKPLANVGVLVTRPAHQADALCLAIEDQGGNAIRFPVLEIAPSQDQQQLLRMVDRLTDFDVAIFISPNAVHYALNVINSRTKIPPQLKFAAVGLSTAKALRAQGRRVDIVPTDSYNSEALLALPELQQVAGQNIVIFRGEGGRELLGETLSTRGAQVAYAECYRRVMPTADIEPLIQLWKKSELDVIVVTSNEGLQNLYVMVGATARHWLLKTPLVVISERMTALAQQLEFEREPIIAHSASDEALLEALITWRIG